MHWGQLEMYDLPEMPKYNSFSRDKIKKLVHREKALKNNRTDLKGYKNDSIFDLREGNW